MIDAHNPSRSPSEAANGAAASGVEPWQGHLEREAGAAFVVDPALSRVEGANETARRLLGLHGAPLRFPVALDAAMPAIRRLRALSEAVADEGGKSMSGTNRQGPSDSEEVLILWCGGRLVSLPAKVTRTTMNDGRPVMLIHATQEDQILTEAPPPASQSQDGIASLRDAAIPPALTPSEATSARYATEPAPDTVPVPPATARDDGETLREIARRIREGGNARTAATPVMPATDASPPIAPPPLAEPKAPGEANGAVPAWPPRFLPQAPDTRHLSKIAHELKTPLSAIVAAAEIMRDEQLGPMGNARYLGYAADIHDSAHHALDVINAMLTGAHSEIRKSECVDLASLADLTVSAMLPLARASHITLQSDNEDGRLKVTGDATAIRQIIFNLVSNALKFTPRGGDVRVATGYLDDGTPFLVVRDTGDGMSEDEITAAFFERDATGRPRHGGGFGIGLPMVRRLAEAMSATIDVDSAPGKGTVVLLTFPS